MTTKKQEKIKFSKAFWVANTVELFERAAYYGVFIVITLYLSRILGFNDIQAASIAGIFPPVCICCPRSPEHWPIRSVSATRCYWLSLC